MFTTIRAYYGAVIAVAPITVVVGFIAAAIAGDKSPNFTFAAIAFLLTGTFFVVLLWRNSRASALPFGSGGPGV